VIALGESLVRRIPCARAPALSALRATSASRAVIARSSDQPVVVAVGAPWCGSCRTYLPIVNRVATDRSGTIVVGTLNTDNYPTLAESYDVESIPTRSSSATARWSTDGSTSCPAQQSSSASNVDPAALPTLDSKAQRAAYNTSLSGKSVSPPLRRIVTLVRGSIP
jgi:thiol-disulfide isomerase/thioredoxin